jgi:hypothetical protein
LNPLQVRFSNEKNGPALIIYIFSAYDYKFGLFQVLNAKVFQPVSTYSIIVQGELGNSGPLNDNGAGSLCYPGVVQRSPQIP